MMKTLLILSVILCVALSIRAAAVAPAEETAVQPKDKPAPRNETEAAARPQPRFQFCLDNWLSYSGNCYFLGHDVSTWSNAEGFCANFQASLASVRDIWEYNFLQRMLRNGGYTFAWIGGFHFEDDWRWEDGSQFNYHNWESRSPADQYQCLQLNSVENKGWSNHACSNRIPFICKTRPSC